MDADIHRLRELMADALLKIVLDALQEKAQMVLAEHGREAQAIRDILLFQVIP